LTTGGTGGGNPAGGATVRASVSSPRQSCHYVAHRGKADIRRKAGSSDLDPKRSFDLNQHKLTGISFLACLMGQSEHKRFKLTPAVRRAMIATNDQKVFRTYGPNGSTWKSERNGVSPRVV